MTTLRQAIRDARAMGLNVKDQPEWGEVRITLERAEILRLFPKLTVRGADNKAEALAHYVDRSDAVEVLASAAVLRGWADFKGKGHAH